jgi:hypothetical protein
MLLPTLIAVRRASDGRTRCEATRVFPQESVGRGPVAAEGGIGMAALPPLRHGLELTTPSCPSPPPPDRREPAVNGGPRSEHDIVATVRRELTDDCRIILQSRVREPPRYP